MRINSLQSRTLAAFSVKSRYYVDTNYLAFSSDIHILSLTVTYGHAERIVLGSGFGDSDKTHSLVIFIIFTPLPCYIPFKIFTDLTCDFKV